MSSRAYVAGVGMIPFVKPGASAPYHVMGAEAARLALADAGLGYDADPAGLCRLRLRRLDLRAAGAVPGRHDRHPDRQRQQQLLDRLDRAVPRAPGDRIRRGRLRAGARLRADEARRAGRGVHRPAERRSTISTRRPNKLVDAPGVPLALRYFGGAGLSHMQKYGTPLETFAKVRAKASRHARNNPLALFRKEVTAEDVHERPGDLAGRDDAADGLPADLRRRGGGAGLGGVCQPARPAQGRPDRRAGDDHRHRRRPSTPAT